MTKSFRKDGGRHFNQSGHPAIETGTSTPAATLLVAPVRYVPITRRWLVSTSPFTSCFKAAVPVVARGDRAVPRHRPAGSRVIGLVGARTGIILPMMFSLTPFNNPADAKPWL
jgi:hypothetical protein